MKRKLLSLLLAGSMVLTLAACGGSGSESGEMEEVIPQEVVSPALTVEPGPDLVEPEPNLIEEIEVTWPGDLSADRTYTVSAAGGFHGGLAWIEFSDGSDDYIGCIDKDGALQFYCDGAYDYSDFEDGYAYLRGDDELYRIDTTGKIVNDYAQELPGESIVAYGGGYVISCRVEPGGFSTGTTKTYTLTDSLGNQAPCDGKAVTGYYGNGIFESGSDLYFAKADVWLNEFLSASGLEPYNWGHLTDLGTDAWFVRKLDWEAGPLSLGDDFACWAWDDQETMYFIVVDPSTGGLTKAALPAECEDFYEVMPISALQDGFISFVDKGSDYFTGIFYILDVSAGTFLKYEGEYAEHVPSANVIADMFSVLSCRAGGKFILPLVGADDNPYFVFLDEDMNALTEPAQAELLYVEGDYLFWDEGVYDLDGNFLRDGDSDRLISAIERNALRDGRMSEGVIRDTVDGIDTYYAYDGTLLFDENGIDYSRAALIELPSAD